jgi:hypothetical protein
MIETIGKPGMCIRTTDRQEILIALDSLLDKRKKEFERIENELKQQGMIRPNDIFKHPTIIIYEDLIKRTEKTKKRVIYTPECKEN